MYEEDLALNNLQWVICHKTLPTSQSTDHISFHLSPTPSHFVLPSLSLTLIHPSLFPSRSIPPFHFISSLSLIPSHSFLSLSYTILLFSTSHLFLLFLSLFLSPQHLFLISLSFSAPMLISLSLSPRLTHTPFSDLLTTCQSPCVSTLIFFLLSSIHHYFSYPSFMIYQYFPNPPLGQDMTQSQFLSKV